MASRKRMSGAEIVIKALVDQGVEVVFGYPGGAVLPIYDAIFQQNQIQVFTHHFHITKKKKIILMKKVTWIM